MTSMRAASPRQSAGFTLIELMVVIVLIGIIFTFAVLSLGGDDVAELMERETRRLAAVLEMAGDEAVIRGEELGIHFGADRYTFLLPGAAGWVEPPADDSLLRQHSLPAGIELQLEVEGEVPPLLVVADDGAEADASPVPQVYILSSGEMTPFRVDLSSTLSDARYFLTASLLGELAWDREEGP